MIIAWKYDPHLGPPHVVLITEIIKTCNIFHPIFKRKNKEHYFWETSAAPGESFLSVHMTFPERTTYMTSRVCTASFYITAATEVIALTAVVLLQPTNVEGMMLLAAFLHHADWNYTKNCGLLEVCMVRDKTS